VSKKVKKMELDALSAKFDGVRDLVVLEPDRVQSDLDFSFRKTLRDKKIRVAMVKNTLARKILGEMGITLKPEVWSKPTLIAWGGESIKDLSKSVDGLLKEIVKKNPKDDKKFKVKTAVADGQECKFEDAMKMPTRLEAIGEIIGMILGPASAIAGALTGPASQLASQIAQVGEPKEGAEATEEVAATSEAPAAS